jgi:hypothetical protein
LRGASLRNISSDWLRKVFEVNVSLWGRLFNFIIPQFEQVRSVTGKSIRSPFPRRSRLKGPDEKYRKRAAL